MQSDVNLIWTGSSTGSAQAITSAAVPSTGVYDAAQGLMLTGSTYPAAPLTIGNASVFGEEMWPGGRRLQIAVMIGAAFAGGTSLNIAMQAAVDAAAGTYPANLSGLTWLTASESGAIPLANLSSANSVAYRFDWPHRIVGQAMPRFWRLLYTPAGTFTAGTVSFAGVGMPVFDNPNGLYPSGFSVGA